MEYFVRENSIVRTIWGRADTVLLIFAGAAAEFALNKSVDWLYFTGRLPFDPIGRLFSTVTYARQIVFSSLRVAESAIEKMRSIHSEVERKRNDTIPNEAYLDVLFMLIHYSIASFELIERTLSQAEKEEVYRVFYRVGTGMGLKNLPANYEKWVGIRTKFLSSNLVRSKYTDDLYQQYKKHLGLFRFKLLKEVQILIVPAQVRTLLNFRTISPLQPFVLLYKVSRKINLDWFFLSLLLPHGYKKQVRDLNTMPEEKRYSHALSVR